MMTDTTTFEAATADVRAAVAAFRAADGLWTAEVLRAFGENDPLARFKPRGHGEPGSELRRLHDAFLAAHDRHNDAWRAFYAARDVMERDRSRPFQERQRLGAFDPLRAA